MITTTKEREEAKKAKILKEAALKKSWKKIKGELALTDMKRFIDFEIDRYKSLALDGKGISAEGDLIDMSNDTRIGYIERHNGLKEISDYIDRHTADLLEKE